MSVKSLKQIFIWPFLLGGFSLLGLILALLADGIVEKIALIFLTGPIVMMFYVYVIKT
jgi:hypothetical protein